MSVRSLLTEEIENELQSLRAMKLGSDEYKSTVEGVTRLVDRKIEMDKIELAEKQAKESQAIDYEFKDRQLRDEKHNRWIGYVLTGAGILIPAGLAVWGTKASFEFEKEGTITTIMGRGFINKLLPRK